MTPTPWLERLIKLIDDRRPPAAAEFGSSEAMYARIRVGEDAAAKLIADLVLDEGARFRGDGSAMHFKMGGVSTSCTSGAVGLLRNWQNAARRRIAKEEARA